MKTPKDSACTFLSDRALRALVKELPTPFYLYDEAGLRQTVRELHDAFGWNCGYRQYFPVRLCVLPAILRMLADEGCGAYCDNAAELALAKRCGFPGERILCAGFAGDEGSPVVLDGAFDQPPAPPKRVLLRLNPGGKLTYDGQNIASLDRFCLGMPPEEAHMLARQFRLFGTEEIGLLFQALTNELHPGYAPAVAQLLFEAVCAFSDVLGFAPDVCCLGDCLAVSDRSGTSGSSLSGSGAEIRRLYEQLLVPKGLGSVRLSTTLGRVRSRRTRSLSRVSAPSGSARSGLFCSTLPAVNLQMRGRWPAAITSVSSVSPSLADAVRVTLWAAQASPLAIWQWAARSLRCLPVIFWSFRQPV